jgi:[ribosomal protein S18]-alanine N-acetyltransferase
MPLTLRYMRLSDVPEVVSIDRRAFSSPWPARSYQFEVAESTHSFMVTLTATPAEADREPSSRLRRLIRNFASNGSYGDKLLGYGGLWNIMDEAHISTIASHPDERGKGYGELLLAAMLRRSVALGAEYVVLEVRKSNTIAQALYRKWGFTVFDVKSNYYRDDGEDAYDMRLTFSPTFITALTAQWAQLCQQYKLQDDYTHTPHPRLNR